MAATVNLPVTSKAPPAVDKAPPTESTSSNGADHSGFSQVLHHQMGKQSSGPVSASDSRKISGNSDKKQSVASNSAAQKQAPTTAKPAADHVAQSQTKTQQQADAQPQTKTQQQDQSQTDNVDTAMAAAMQTPATPMSQLRELVAASLHNNGQDGNVLPLEANAGPNASTDKQQAEMMKLLAQRASTAGDAGQQLQQASMSTSAGQENSGLPQELQLLEQRIQKQIDLQSQPAAQASTGSDAVDSNTPKLDVKQLQGLENALQSLAKANTKGDAKGLATAWDQLRNRLQELQLSQDDNTTESPDGLAGMLKSLKQEMASLQQTAHLHTGASDKAVRLAFQDMLNKVSLHLQQTDKPVSQPANSTSLLNAGLANSSSPSVSQTQGQQPGQTSLPTTTVNVPVHNQAWGQAIGERLQWMVKQDMKHAEIKLNPRHLGPIEVKIAMNHDQATVSFSAHHVMTKDALETAIPRLREMFGNNGLNLIDVNVSHHSGSEGQQANANSQQGQSGGSNNSSWSSFDANSNEPLATDIRSPQWFGSNRMLDTYV